MIVGLSVQNQSKSISQVQGTKKLHSKARISIPDINTTKAGVILQSFNTNQQLRSTILQTLFK